MRNKEDIMKINECVPEKISKTLLAFLLLAVSLGMVIIGITILPYVGFLVALPVLAIAVYVFRLSLNDECQIDFSS